MASSDGSGWMIAVAIGMHACMSSMPTVKPVEVNRPVQIELTGDALECLCAEHRDDEARAQPEIDNHPRYLERQP